MGLLAQNNFRLGRSLGRNRQGAAEQLAASTTNRLNETNKFQFDPIRGTGRACRLVVDQREIQFAPKFYF